VNGRFPHRFIYVIFLIILAITNIYYVQGHSWYNIGTMLAKLVRHTLCLETSTQFLFDGPLVFMHREAILTVGRRR
jgi:hypothetical protein